MVTGWRKAHFFAPRANRGTPPVALAPTAGAHGRVNVAQAAPVVLGKQDGQRGECGPAIAEFQKLQAVPQLSWLQILPFVEINYDVVLAHFEFSCAPVKPARCSE
jgi:hypothetical protein